MKTFDYYQTEVFRFYLEKKYADSLRVASEAAEQFPDKTARTSFWIACLNARLGRLDEALEALTEGLRKGAWWHEDTLGDADLDQIRRTPEFDRIKKECYNLKSVSAKVAKPDLLVMDPRVSGTESWPVLIVLHQRGGDNPSQTSREWSSVLQRGFGLAVPWSSQVYDPDRRCWDNLEIAEKGHDVDVFTTKQAQRCRLREGRLRRILSRSRCRDLHVTEEDSYVQRIRCCGTIRLGGTRSPTRSGTEPSQSSIHVLRTIQQRQRNPRLHIHRRE